MSSDLHGWQAYLDRFVEFDDPADRDRVIDLISAGPSSGQQDPEALRVLAGLLIERYQDSGADPADRDSAADTLGRLLSLLPADDLDADVIAGLRGHLLAEAGVHTAEVADLLGRGLAADPDEEDRQMLLYWRAICLSAAGPTSERLDELIHDLDELLRSLPGDHPARPEVSLRLGDALANQRGGPQDAERAIRLLSAAYEQLSPGGVRADVAANLSLLHENDPEAAVGWIRAALDEPGGESAERHAYLGQLLIRAVLPVGPHDVVTMAPEVAGRLFAAAMTQPATRDRITEARRHLEHALALEPGHMQARSLLTMVGLIVPAGSTDPVSSEAIREGVATALQVVATLPADAQNAAEMRALGLLLEVEPGIDKLRKAVAGLAKTHPLRPRLLARLGIALTATGEHVEAVGLLANALPRVPDEDPARRTGMTALVRALGGALRHDIRRSELDRLADELGPLASNDQADTAAWLALGSVYLLRGVRSSARADFEKGVTYLNLVIAASPENDELVALLRFLMACALTDRFPVDQDLQYLDDALAILDERPSPAALDPAALSMARGMARLLRAGHDRDPRTRGEQAIADFEEALTLLAQDSPHRATVQATLTGARVLAGQAVSPMAMAEVLRFTSGVDTDMIQDKAAIVAVLDAYARFNLAPATADAEAALRAAAQLSEREGRYPEVFLSEVVDLARRGRGETAEAIRAAVSGLRGRLSGVLIQKGVQRALALSYEAAEEALKAAHRALDAGMSAEAIEALELARGMTLHAATAGLPTSPSAPPPSPRGVPLPSDERTSAVLADRERFRPPPAAEIAAALSDAGWDALVYLLPGPGRALIVRPDTTVEDLLLPGLDEGKTLSAYAATHERVLSLLRTDALDAGRQAEWRSALQDVCSWAWLAVMRPLLAHVGAQGEIARVVLVPWGELGTVPWQAAGVAAEGAYVFRHAAVSFAVSARQLTRTAQAALPYDTTPVIVADPKGKVLRWGRWECDEILRIAYPAARCFGRWREGSAPVATEPATPAALLDLLPGAAHPATMVHFGCHAMSKPLPTESGLLLQEKLTVERLLDRPPADGPGPLVVLSACMSDFTQDNYDEALTLATALLATGASTVIGSRWAIADDARTALMMVMFHRYLREYGPAEALRRTQAWMVEPRGDDLPAGVSPELVARAYRLNLGDPLIWGAFTHQGR